MRGAFALAYAPCYLSCMATHQNKQYIPNEEEILAYMYAPALVAESMFAQRTSTNMDRAFAAFVFATCGLFNHTSIVGVA